MRVKCNFKWGRIYCHGWAHQTLYLLCTCLDSQLDSNNWMLSLMKISTEDWLVPGETKRPALQRREFKDPSSCCTLDRVQKTLLSPCLEEEVVRKTPDSFLDALLIVPSGPTILWMGLTQNRLLVFWGKKNLRVTWPRAQLEAKPFWFS